MRAFVSFLLLFRSHVSNCFVRHESISSVIRHKSISSVSWGKIRYFNIILSVQSIVSIEKLIMSSNYESDNLFDVKIEIDAQLALKKIALLQARADEKLMKINFSALTQLIDSQQKKIFKKSFDALIQSDDKKYVIWIIETEIEFENWFQKYTSWEIDIVVKKRKHIMSKWESRTRKADVWVDWHETVDLDQERSHVICKDCEFITLHSTSENINNNTMTRHRSTSEKQCTTKINERLRRQSLLTKSFQTICASLYVALYVALLSFYCFA